MVQQSGLVHPSVRDTSSTRRRRVKQEKGARGAAEHETGPEYFFSLYMTDGNKQSVSKQRERKEIRDLRFPDASDLHRQRHHRAPDRISPSPTLIYVLLIRYFRYFEP